MIFDQPMDTYEFLARGWHSGKIRTQMADTLLRRISGLNYLPLPSDHCDAGPRFRGDVETDRAVGGLLKNFWAGALRDDLVKLADHYRADAARSVITVLRLGSGYSLDWHNHLAAGCTATLLLYLFDGEDAGDGGDLVLGELGRDMQSIDEVKRFRPAHGDAILIGDASHPLLMHKAERWTGLGNRYLVSFAFNADDW
jgi:hypothetical protein